MKTVKYIATGLVYGNYWGGGKGAYASRILKSDTKEDIIEQATKGLDGSLDGGMGYESLIGALLNIACITTVIIDGKEFENIEYELEFIGDLSEEDMDFLEECHYR